MEKPKLTTYQRRCLRYLQKHPTATYREIAKAVKVKHAGSVQAIIKALTKKGLMAATKTPGSWNLNAVDTTEGTPKRAQDEGAVGAVGVAGVPGPVEETV